MARIHKYMKHVYQLYVCVCVCMLLCIHVLVCMGMFECGHAHVCACVCVHLCMYVHEYEHSDLWNYFCHYW
jgi:hypothetical protein